MAGTKYAVQLCEEHSISDTYTTSFLHSAIAWHLIEISGSLLFASSEKLNPPFRAKWVSGMKIVWLLMLPYYSLWGGAQLSLSVLLLCNNNCRFCTFTVHIHFEVSSLQASPLSALLTCFDMACTFPAITINNTHTETIATVTTLTVSKHSPTCKT